MTAYDELSASEKAECDALETELKQLRSGSNGARKVKIQAYITKLEMAKHTNRGYLLEAINEIADGL